MGPSAHDQTFALPVELKEITELSGVKKQAGAELYQKLSKKFKKVRKKCEKHQIFRKLAADLSADTSADEVGRINISSFDAHIDILTNDIMVDAIHVNYVISFFFNFK